MLLGKKLIIHVPVSQVDNQSTYKSNNTRKIVYKVRRGDSLSEIAQKYKVSVKNLKNWNKLESDMVYIGQKLIIYRKYY